VLTQDRLGLSLLCFLSQPQGVFGTFQLYRGSGRGAGGVRGPRV
jgi:hypothetical protein